MFLRRIGSLPARPHSAIREYYRASYSPGINSVCPCLCFEFSCQPSWRSGRPSTPLATGCHPFDLETPAIESGKRSGDRTNPDEKCHQRRMHLGPDLSPLVLARQRELFGSRPLALTPSPRELLAKQLASLAGLHRPHPRKSFHRRLIRSVPGVSAVLR